MESAKISETGRITIPIKIRRQLGLHAGDSVLFTQNKNGEIVLQNASVAAIREAQAAFTGAAEELGVKDEEDVQKLVDEVRYEGK